MTEFITTPRGTFAYKVSGNPEGKPLVFVGGLGADKNSWDEVLDGFSRYRCISFDNRGSGDSPTTPGPYTITQLAEDAHAVVTALGVAGAPAVGSSMGGAICQEWAFLYPDDMSKLVLTNTWSRTDSYGRVLFEHVAFLAAEGHAAAVSDAALLFSFSPDFVRTNPAVAQEARAAASLDMIGFEAAAHACRNHDSHNKLDSIHHPTLVIAGLRDIVTSPWHSEAIVAEMPNASLIQIDAGHSVCGERPDEWASVVSRWLAG
ncbi:alpha/beta hydrolase [Streptomyces sp. NPDC093252]|uniref:alpha/beta fold hydrolase n=1 Tax=Streptomyces sp. NPDC093252 TaxID=3154980 RepID=UPI00342BFBEB